ncbi:MAG: hypothetical protein CM15mP14_2560 [Rhodospirillaceae bacterium]|nr:MAG: hypothetical protein CM15mP14_2560 [Rhodospirillaceae bacterium]
MQSEPLYILPLPRKYVGAPGSSGVATINVGTEISFNFSFVSKLHIAWLIFESHRIKIFKGFRQILIPRNFIFYCIYSEPTSH